MNTKKRPPIHPGEILKEEFLEAMGMNQQQLAEGINVSVEYINHIIQGQQAITADMALRLGRYFSMSPMRNPIFSKNRISLPPLKWSGNFRHPVLG